jgi:translation elongation factor EF-1alpha
MAEETEKEVGVITHYFSNISVGIIELSAPLKVGDTIHVKGAHDDFTQTVDSMQIEHESVESAKEGDMIGIKVAEKVHPHDKVFLVVE